MKASRSGRRMLAAAGIALAAGACDDGRQRHLIDTYRAATFSSSTSELARGSLDLSATVDLGRAYEVTAKRIEYVAVPAASRPPISPDGELQRPKVQAAEVAAEEMAAGEGRGDAAPAPGVRLRASLPSRLLRDQELYYRWVLEYSSGGDRVTMRKSPIFRTDGERAGSRAGDVVVTS